jgi:hypothetical protein
VTGGPGQDKTASSHFIPDVFSPSSAAWDLARAEAQYRLALALVGQAPDGLPLPSRMMVIQRRFYRYARYADCGIAASSPASARPSLEAWLQTLQEKNAELTRTHGLEEVRLEAERRIRVGLPSPSEEEDLTDLAAGGILQAAGPRGDLLPHRGTPLRWQTPPEAPTPVLSLRSLEDLQGQRALGGSLLLVLLVLLVWTLARFPVLHAWFRVFWPEQVIVLGGVGWWTLGRPPVVLILVVIGVLARGLFLGRRGLALWHRTEAPKKPGSSVGRAPRSSVLQT